MTRERRTFDLVIHARADETISVQQRHSHFFDEIKDLPLPWGFNSKPIPRIPRFREDEDVVVFNLTKFFGNKVQRAQMTYVHRDFADDTGMSDDSLMIDFDPSVVDFHQMVYVIIPKFVEAFDAYLVECYDDQFVDMAWNEEEKDGYVLFSPKSRKGINPRSKVDEIWPISYFDDLLCKRAFKLSSAEVVGRLEGKVEHVELLHNGVYLVGTSEIPSIEYTQEFCRAMKTALRSKRQSKS